MELLSARRGTGLRTRSSEDLLWIGWLSHPTMRPLQLLQVLNNVTHDDQLSQISCLYKYNIFRHVGYSGLLEAENKEPRGMDMLKWSRGFGRSVKYLDRSGNYYFLFSIYFAIFLLMFSFTYLLFYFIVLQCLYVKHFESALCLESAT